MVPNPNLHQPLGVGLTTPAPAVERGGLGTSPNYHFVFFNLSIELWSWGLANGLELDQILCRSQIFKGHSGKKMLTILIPNAFDLKKSPTSTSYLEVHGILPLRVRLGGKNTGLSNVLRTIKISFTNKTPEGRNRFERGKTLIYGIFYCGFQNFPSA